MNSLQAFANGEAARAAGNEAKVFDWDEAARRIVKSGAKNASAGLGEDWEWTGGEILRDGKPVPKNETYTYLASIWATPEIELDGECSDCFRLVSETDGWDADTYWPDSALAILAEV